MEYITKQQVILICLLVAIVTSITTAISVVSLTDTSSTPQGTIYKVIETTIAKVADIPAVQSIVPASVTPSAPSAPTELSPAAIAQNGAKSLVRIYDTANGTRTYVALGAAVGQKNGVVTTALASENTAASVYVAVGPAGVDIPASFVKDTIAGSFGYFTLNYQSNQARVQPIELKGTATLSLGANVVALGGKESNNVVSTGIVKELSGLASDSTASTTKNVVTTDMALTSSYSGFLLFDTQGNVVALEERMNEADKAPVFLNASLVKAALAGLL